MALFLIVDFAHHKLMDAASWFRFVGGPELLGAVGFVKRYQPLASKIGQQVIETVAADEHFVGRKGDADLAVRSLCTNEPGPREDVFPFVQNYL
jgi:hypothetical protein